MKVNKKIVAASLAAVLGVTCCYGVYTYLTDSALMNGSTETGEVSISATSSYLSATCTSTGTSACYVQPTYTVFVTLNDMILETCSDDGYKALDTLDVALYDATSGTALTLDTEQSEMVSEYVYKLVYVGDIEVLSGTLDKIAGEAVTESFSLDLLSKDGGDLPYYMMAATVDFSATFDAVQYANVDDVDAIVWSDTVMND